MDEKLEKYISLLLKYKKKINLMGIDSYDELKKIIDDSFILLPKTISSVLDLGAGGGVVGVPLKLLNSHISISFMDKARKKMHILEHILLQIKVDFADIYIGDAEKLKENVCKKFDLIVSRGMGETAFVLRMGVPFLNDGGKIFLWKSKNYEIEPNLYNDYGVKKYSIDEKSYCKILKLEF